MVYPIRRLRALFDLMPSLDSRYWRTLEAHYYPDAVTHVGQLR